MELQNNVMNAECLTEENAIRAVSSRLKPGDTLILDIGNNYFHQTDKLYDVLFQNGFYVRKTLVNGRNQLLVAYTDEKHKL
jgi:6-phosphogluconate dehydrogenase (decarboxylating)